uniref:KH domain-containing protein n=1 Tax=Syphacia muris TaxID=451379 RepID=A0A0N5AH41_9BILA
MNKYEVKDFISTTVNDVELSVEYLAELLKEKKQLDLFPQAFRIIGRILNNEIKRVRMALFKCHFSFQHLNLPERYGQNIMVQKKIYVPRKEHPNFNFVGRILGPRGMTAKQLEEETGCKIMIRGRGSMRDSKKEEINRGKPNWEHLDDDLHVLVQCEDTPNRVYIKLEAATSEIKKLLVPTPEGSDELKRNQLMELAIINGTYRPTNKYGNFVLWFSARLFAPVTPLKLISPGTLKNQFLVSPLKSPTVPSSTQLTSPRDLVAFSSCFQSTSPGLNPHDSSIELPLNQFLADPGSNFFD